MRNNITSKVNEKGTIKLLLENGNILLLDKTRFVSELRRNLISLRVLDDMELGIKNDQWQIKIFRGYDLITKTPKRHGLHLL